MSSAKSETSNTTGGVKMANNAEFFICNANIVGNLNRVWGHRNTVTGNGNQVYGNWNRVAGTRNTVRGINNRVLGGKNDVVDAGVDGAASEASSTANQSIPASNNSDDHAVPVESGAEVLVSVCKRVRVRTDANGRRQCENFHVELVERRLFGVDLSSSWTASTPSKAFGGGGVGSASCLYDLSGLDGADSDAAGLPCCVCLGRERCVKLSPCRHVPVCLACARRLFDGARARTVACPLCRSPVDAVERLFIN